MELKENIKFCYNKLYVKMEKDYRIAVTDETLHKSVAMR